MNGKYYFSAAMDVPQDKEDLFDEVYDKEHIPYLSEVPGVLAIARFTTQPLKMVIGGVEQEIIIENQPKHTAIYEIEDQKFSYPQNGQKQSIKVVGRLKLANTPSTEDTYY